MQGGEAEQRMPDLDNQVEYWNRTGLTKRFGHPLNFGRLKGLLPAESLILDLGCGYGRALEILVDQRYRNLLGFDSAPAMVAAARKRVPDGQFAIAEAPNLPLPNDSVAATLLFAVLTCVPSDAGQQAIIREADRVLRPGGLLYISDLWLQPDERNRERYQLCHVKYGSYGVFELDEGVVLRHHDRRWIDELTRGFSLVALDELIVDTMNGHTAQAFQWFGHKPLAV
jgi:SAM-dependent methyltransferase